MKNLILIVITFFLTTNLNSQEKKVELKSANTLQTGIGVVDMKKYSVNQRLIKVLLNNLKILEENIEIPSLSKKMS